MDFRCNNACVFCNQSETSRDPGVSERIASELRKLASEGVDFVTFSGGEATLDLTRLEELVGLARELGIDTIAVQTNGRRLAYANVAQKLVDAGVGRFDVSLHGTNAATHDWVTRVPGAFKQTIRGLREIRRVGGDISLHMVLVKSNFRQVREMVLLAAKLRIRSINFRFVVPEGRVNEEKTLPSLVPKYSLVMPLLMQAKATAKRMGISIYLHDFPDSVAGALASDIVREPARWVGEGAQSWPRSERVLPGESSFSLEDRKRNGVSKAYLEYYGSSEFLLEDSADEAMAPAAAVRAS